MALHAHFANLLDASSSVRLEDKTKDLGDDIVEHLAVVGIVKLRALRTRCILIAHAA